MRWLAGSALAVLIVAALAGGYFYWFFEEPRAAGPLSQDLVARFDPGERNQGLSEAVAAHVNPAMNLAEQQTIFYANGFDCFISQVEVTGSQYLTCRRPIEGRHNCDHLFYYVYQTRGGDVVKRLATVLHRDNRDKVLGRCAYRPFPVDEPVERFPHDG